MARCTFWFVDGDRKTDYVSVEAEEFHEDEGYLVAYSEHHEIVAMFKKDIIAGAYRTERRG